MLSESCNFPLWPIPLFVAFELHDTEEVQGELQLLSKTDEPIAGAVPLLLQMTSPKEFDAELQFDLSSLRVTVESILLSLSLYPKYYQHIGRRTNFFIFIKKPSPCRR